MKELTGHDEIEFEKLDSEIKHRWSCMKPKLDELAELSVQMKESGLYLVKFQTWDEYTEARFGRSARAMEALVYRERKKAKQIAASKPEPAVHKVCTTNLEYVGTEIEEKRMTRQCGPVEMHPPAPLPVATSSAHPVPASPLIADKVNQIVREALRLQTPNGPEAFFSPPFRHLLAQLVGLQKMIQPPLPGMEEHLAEPSAAKKARATLPEIIAFVTSSEINLPESDAKAFFYHMESQGWKVNRMAVKDWKMTVRKWQEYGYMASQKRAQGNGHGKPQETHWKTKELDAELAQLRKEEAEFERKRMARGSK